MNSKSISSRLIRKIIGAFILIILLVGIAYVSITLYFTNKYFEEASQQLNSELANQLIEEIKAEIKI